MANRHPIGRICPICHTTHQRGETLRMYTNWLVEQLAAGRGNPAHEEIHRIAENELSLKAGFRILSAYRLITGVKVWVITEADRSATTLLLPEEC